MRGFWSPLLFLKLYNPNSFSVSTLSAYFLSLFFPSSSRFCSLSWSWFSFQRVCYVKVQLLLGICDRNPLCCLRLAYGFCWELMNQFWSYERYYHTRHSVIYLWPLMDTKNVIVHPDFLLYAMQGCQWTVERWLFLQCYMSHISLQFFLFIWSFYFLSSSPNPFCSFELQFSILFSKVACCGLQPS